MHKLIVATSNSGKYKEIKEILKGLPFEFSCLKDYWDPIPKIPEDGNTFYENAKAKAKWVYKKTGLFTLADDSGLEVDFLNGLPGVNSARFSGNEHDKERDKKNIAKLLDFLKDCPKDKRTARFKCVVVFIISDKEEIASEGVCEGRIIYEPKGTNGFGYDPIFVPDGFNLTFAELDGKTKNSISHRGKALLNLRRILNERFRSSLQHL
jgi:XTP/dITP diphosphohydrolase